MRQITKIIVISTIIIFTSLSIGMLFSGNMRKDYDKTLIHSSGIQSDLIMVHPDHLDRR